MLNISIWIYFEPYIYIYIYIPPTHTGAETEGGKQGWDPARKLFFQLSFDNLYDFS
jgi:hypothetical protein